MKKKERIFNAPIQLYAEFMTNPTACLKNAFWYAMYSHSLKIKGEFNGQNTLERIDASCEELNIAHKHKQAIYDNGPRLVEKFPANSPMTGISEHHLVDFYINDKAQDEKAILLGFLALKSIVGKNVYKKDRQ